MTKRLIASQFYVTEGQGSHHKLLYFPKKGWQSKTDSAFNFMVSKGTLQPLSEPEAEKLAALRRTATLRWLPKTIGLRPVISIKNDKLEVDIIHSKSYLRGLLQKTGHTYMNAQRLNQIWKRLPKNKIEKLYMVSVDIHDAYGSMIQDKVLQIVQETSEMYLGEDFMLKSVHIDYWRKTRVCRELQNDRSYSNNCQTRKVSDLMTTIQRAIKCQTIKRKKRTFLVTKGMSQAMPLSAALCNLYIAHMDRARLAEFSAEPCDTMIRAVDDYLYITPDKARAKRFLDVMSTGFQDYGMYINPNKTQHNLETTSEINFFGYLIDPDSQEVYVKYSQGENAPYRNSVTFSNWADPLAVMKDKLKRIAAFKLNSLTTDPEYMSVEGAMWNVFQTACVVACSFKAMLGSWRSSFDLSTLSDLVHDSADNIAKKVYRLRNSNGMRLHETRWVAVRAYRLCLSHGAADDSNFLGDLVPALECMEEHYRSTVRPTRFRLFWNITESLPPQFTQGH
uniref:Telomerase reverse transcriptase n=1 Tax=Graphocephala atropunctata TaxID=36148 RepID=A0A1B6M5A4_9HEMI